MDIEIHPSEVIAQMEKRFPKELEICLQAVQIKKMAELLDKATPEGDGQKFDYEFEDAEVQS